MADVVAAARDSREKLRWSHNGLGAIMHVIGQSLLDNQGISAQDVPLSGAAKSRASIMAAQVDYGIIGIHQCRGFENYLRILGIVDMARNGLFPEVATFAPIRSVTSSMPRERSRLSNRQRSWNPTGAGPTSPGRNSPILRPRISPSHVPVRIGRRTAEA